MASMEPGVVQHRAVHPLWRTCAYACILFAVVSTFMYAKTAFLEPATYGGVASASLGGALLRTTDNGRIDVVVKGLKPDTPLARAGVHEGDRLRLDIPWNDFRSLGTGEVFGFTRVAPGKPQHLQFVVPEFMGHSKEVGNVRFLITLFDLGVGLLLFFRCRGDVGVEALGMAFVASTISSNFPASPGWSLFWIGVAYAGVAATPFLTLAFAMHFYNKHSRPIAAPVWKLFWILVCVLALCFVVAFGSDYFAYTSPPIKFNLTVIFGEEMFSYLATIYFFVRGFRISQGELKKRYSFLLIALLLTFCLTLVQTISFLVLKQARMNPENPLYDVNVVLSLLGPLLFAYTVLRHKVVDLGFVLNRTLVYGVVSLLLLSAFGLIEWAVAHLITLEGHNASVALDAGIAVAVTLSFDRVRDFVEGRLEALFFRRWHDKERRLRRFVGEASFITRSETLKTAFVGELGHFTDGAAVGLYLEAGEAGYGGLDAPPPWPATLDNDDPILVTMRARRKPIDPSETSSTLAVALALPMLHRNSLLGFVLLGAKPGGGSYRPDEIDVMGHAAHQVGLDLDALKIEQLERDGAQLIQKVHTLEHENALLRLSSAIA